MQIDPNTGRGKQNGNARLTEMDVRAIRKLAEVDHVGPREIARMYLVSTETVRRILRRETWNWLADVPRKSEEELTAEAKASQAKVLQMLGMAAPDAESSLASRNASAAPVAASDGPEGSGLNRLVKESSKLGDSMLNELIGGKKDDTSSSE